MIDQNKANTRNSVVKSSFIVGGMTFISRVSGFGRQRGVLALRPLALGAGAEGVADVAV